MIKEIERGGVGGILAGMSESGRHSFDRDALHDEQRRWEVYHVEILGDERVQTIKIYFNHIGYCAIPDIGDLKQEPVKICPRKGVSLKYLPFDLHEKTKRNGWIFI